MRQNEMSKMLFNQLKLSELVAALEMLDTHKHHYPIACTGTYSRQLQDYLSQWDTKELALNVNTKGKRGREG